jgi:hypothetical protein
MIILALVLSVSVLAACTTEQPEQEPAEQSVQEAVDQPEDTAQDALEEADAVKEEVLENVAGAMDLTGSWEDEISQRAHMDVTKNADGSYNIVVSWGSSAWESAVWNIHGTYDETSGMLSYSDGAYSIHTWDEDGVETVSGEETTKGAFMKEGEKLRWQDSKNSDSGLFSKVSQ